MTDIHNIATRSYNMSKIKGFDTKPEMLVRRFLYSKGIRYRLYQKELPGKPDVTLSKYKTVIFINGCFWHGHSGCRYFVVPKTKTEWWNDKIQKTIELDKQNKLTLENAGWKIITIWECDLKKAKRDNTLENLYTTILM
jgi:DNA mismatch endonuclease (patch repair protein)